MAESESVSPKSRTEETNLLGYHIKQLMKGEDVGYQTAYDCMNLIMEQRVDALDTNFASYFAAMTAKGPTKAELLGIYDAVLDFTGLETGRETISTDEPVYSICGCGKTDYKMFNVSTAASFIAAAADVCITKQGSSGTSKSTGAADAVELAGVELDVETDRMKASAAEDSIGFFTIGDKVTAFDEIYGGRFYVYQPISYGFAGLVNPVDLDGLVYGTMTEDTELVASVLREYGFDDTMVVHSEIKPGYYIDELSVFGESKYSVIRGDEIHTEEATFDHFTDADGPESVKSGTSTENTEAFMAAILGVEGGKTDMACLNAGATLYAAGTVDSITEGAEVAKRKAESGAAYEQLRHLVANSNGDLDVLEDLRKRVLRKY